MSTMPMTTIPMTTMAPRIASLLYLATLCVSAQQVWANQDRSDQFKVRSDHLVNKLKYMGEIAQSAY